MQTVNLDTIDLVLPVPLHPARFRKRGFNQAWLLDARNQHALWGFAVISVERGKIDDAVRFYEMAMAIRPGPEKLVEEYEELRRLLP